MKYYGYRFPHFAPEKSYLDDRVGTWIGLMGSFVYFMAGYDAGGLRAPIQSNLLLTLVDPVLLWYVSWLAVDFRWARRVMLFLSGCGTLLGTVVLALMFIDSAHLVASVISFFLLNLVTLLLSWRNRQNWLCD